MYRYLSNYLHIYAALGPRVQRYLWWKQHLTKLQMAQFLVFIAHSAQPLLIDCQYPKVDDCQLF